MKKIILIGIILLAAVLRFNQLNTLPALNADEAAIGYNAYSLIQTGRDEHGNPWPINFQSFNDYKPGLFFYIVLPFVKVLGLNEWAVRIPGALLGVGTVLVIYFLVVELLKYVPKNPYAIRYTPYVAAMLLAISPWHIHFSRGGWEVNVGTFFITLGMWTFLKGLRQNKWWLLSVIAFVASLYSYHAARIVVPLLAVGLVLLYRKTLLERKGSLIVPIIVGVLLILPLGRDLSGVAGASRASGVSIFADPGTIDRINEQRGEHGDITNFPAVLLHNKGVNYTLEFLQNWGEHFWGEFLFLSGDEIQRNKVPETGLLYLFDLPLLIIGLLVIARNIRVGSASWRIILWWLIIAPTAAALTFQSPHALRAHNMVIPFTIISALGMVNIIDWLRSKAKGSSRDGASFSPRRWNYIYTSGIVAVFLLIGWNFTRYLHQYYNHMAKEYPFSSQYAVKELVSYVKERHDKYPLFAITDRYDQPYILFLFYLQYPPEKFQNAHALSSRDKFGFSTVRDFDKTAELSSTSYKQSLTTYKFHFEALSGKWEPISERFRGGLVIGTDEEISDGANIIHRIYFPNGKTAFKIVSN